MKRLFLLPISLPLFSFLMFTSSVVHAQTPNAPTITWPPPDSTIQSNRPDFIWIGDIHDMYEVHVNTTNNPTAVDGWNSGQVSSTANTAMCGALNPQTKYYVFVRLRNGGVWGAWSAYNRYFYVDGQFLNDPYYVGEPVGGQWPQSTIFNPARNEYLCAFADAGSVSYYRLDSTGAKIGAKVTITDDTYLDGIHEPVVAYNSVNAEYLIVYSGWTLDGTPQVHDDIRGQRVNASTGAKIGGSYMIFTPSPYSAVYELGLSYSAASNVYFVVWHHGISINILGYRLAGATGAVTGGQIVVSTGWSRLCAVPNIAYNSSANEFEVMYQVDREEIGAGWDLHGQRVRASDGALLGGSHAISTVAPQWDMNGDIAYDSNLNRYLAVFESHSAPNHIWGQFVTATGGLSGSPFPFLSDPYSGGAVHVDWLPSTKEYVCAFHDCCTESDYARRISQTGTVLGERFRTNGNVYNLGNFYPTPVANTISNEFLICWFNQYNDVYNRRYKTFTPFSYLPNVSIDLNAVNYELGMTAPIGGDGDTVSSSTGGRECRKNMDPGYNDAYFYFTVSDSFAYQGSKPRVDIHVDYYDTGTTSLTLQYDGTPGAYTNGGSITLTNTNTWKTAVLAVSDAYFGNRQNNGADFRIYTGGGVTRYLDFVKVAEGVVIPPPAAPTVTGPANGSTVTTLTPTITWTGDAHDQYQVRISQQNDSNTSTNGWDSGIVTSTGNSAVSGTLRNYSFYYVFVRLHNAGGWGNWSAAGYNFIVNTNNVNGTVYLGNSLPTANLWQIYDTGSYENGSGITSTIVADGGSNVWKLFDNSTVNRCKEKYTNGMNISFDTGASVASRFRASGVSGTPTYCLGISNGNVGGMYLRLYTTEVRLVDINGTNRGSYLLDATVYHKYQLTVKNSTAGNNATAVWRVYVDGAQRITWTGAGTDNGFDGFMAGQAGTAAKGTWWFDWIAARADGEFAPSAWDPVY